MSDQKNTGENAQDNKSSSKIVLAVAGIVVIAAAIAGIVFVSGNGVVQNGADKTAQATAQTQPAAGEEGDQMIKLGNPTVAVVEGEDIKRSEVLSFINQMPAQLRQQPIQKLFPMALQQVVTNQLIAMKAEKADLQDDKEVAEQVAEARKQVIRSIYLERQLEERITKKKLLKEYENLLDRYEGVQETKARHILVETKEEAEKLIEKLKGGTDFAELAKEASTGPTANQGGDLGWFARDEMVEPFAEAAFKIEPGNISEEPVETRFGFHVIKVEDRRDREAPEFEDVKQQLEGQLRQQVLQDMVQEWTEQAKVEMYDINGEPVKGN